MVELPRHLGRLTLYRLLVVSGLLLLTKNALLQPIPGLLTGRETAWNPLEFFIGGLFLLTIAYLFWLRSGRYLGLLARIQCAVDPFLVTLLLILSGGDDSPLHFLYALAILETAWLAGRRDALMVAGISLILSVAAILLIGLLSGLPPPRDDFLLRLLLFNGAAFGLTALLGGTLAHKARLLQQTLERQRDSLADMATRNQQILEAMPFGLLSVNTQGIIRGVNAAAAHILETPVHRLQDHPLTGILPELAEMAGSHDRELISREFKRGNRWLGVTMTPLSDRLLHGVGTLFVIQDLTPWRRLHTELAEREKLALTGRMAAFVAHEIRNPLASILSAAQVSKQARSEEQRERLRTIIMEEVARLKQLTTDFLFFARPPQPQREIIALPAFLSQMRETLQRDPTWGPERVLEVRSTPNTHVRFDPAHLRQLFWNLFANAAQAAPNGKRVTVTIRRLSPAEVLTVVADDGPGIPPGDIDKAMEPFHTTRSTGTGLGLSVVSQLMLLNGGALSLESGGSSRLPEMTGLSGLHVHLVMEAAHGQHPDL